MSVDRYLFHFKGQFIKELTIALLAKMFSRQVVIQEQVLF